MVPAALSTLRLLAAGSLVALAVFAFVAAPSSCDWGLNAYLLAGVALFLGLAALPFATSGGLIVVSRIGSSLLLGCAVLTVWTSGLFVANFQLLCRLF